MKTELPRSPYDQIHGLVYFGRMLDKIRLHAAEKLSADYIPNLGIKFDERCLRFLNVSYEDLKKVVLAGATDEEVWQWCQKNGRALTAEEITVWNHFMTKRGWHDDMTETLQRRLKEGGWEDRKDVQTLFDYIDLDEGRKRWLKEARQHELFSPRAAGFQGA